SGGAHPSYAHGYYERDNRFNRVPGLIEAVVALVIAISVGRMCATRYQADGGQRPGWQHAGIHRRLQVIDNFLNGDDAALGCQSRLLLYTKNPGDQHVALAVGLLRVDHGDVRTHAWHCRQLLAGEGAVDELDHRVDLRQIGAEVGTQHRERQAGGAGDIGIGQIGVAVLFDFQQLRPLLFHRVAQTMQGTDTGVSAPGENQLLRTAGADQQVID